MRRPRPLAAPPANPAEKHEGCSASLPKRFKSGERHLRLHVAPSRSTTALRAHPTSWHHVQDPPPNHPPRRAHTMNASGLSGSGSWSRMASSLAVGWLLAAWSPGRSRSKGRSGAPGLWQQALARSTIAQNETTSVDSSALPPIRTLLYGRAPLKGHPLLQLWRGRLLKTSFSSSLLPPPSSSPLPLLARRCGRPSAGGGLALVWAVVFFVSSQVMLAMSSHAVLSLPFICFLNWLKSQQRTS